MSRVIHCLPFHKSGTIWFWFSLSCLRWFYFQQFVLSTSQTVHPPPLCSLSVFILFDRDELWDLYKDFFHQRLLQGHLRICLFGPVPSANGKGKKESPYWTSSRTTVTNWAVYYFKLYWISSRFHEMLYQLYLLRTSISHHSEYGGKETSLHLFKLTSTFYCLVGWDNMDTSCPRLAVTRFQPIFMVSSLYIYIYIYI